MADTDIHISGLATSWDIEDMVNKLVEAQSYIKLNYEKEKEEVNFDIAAWAEISTYASALTDSLDTLREWETWNKMSAISSDESKVTALASSSAVPATYKIEVTNLAQSHTLSSDTVTALPGAAPDWNANTDLVAGGALVAGDTFTIQGQTITIGATESLNSLVGKINTASTSMSTANKVQASIINNTLVIQRVQTGASTITMAETSGNPLQDLGLFIGGTSDYKHVTVAAKDANFTINGMGITRSSNTNLTDVVTGVTLNLLDETTSPVTLTINHDTATPKTAITDFVEKYNQLAEVLEYFGKKSLGGAGLGGSKIDELGELYNDSLVYSIERNMRVEATESKYPYLNAINASYTYKGRTGIADSLEDMGVWTSSEANTLQVTDEDKLDHMLDNYFDTAEQLFRGIYDPAQGYVHGIASDFYQYADNVSTSITGEIAVHTEALEDQVETYDTRIATEEERLKNLETRLWTAFTNMESAYERMKNNVAWLASQIKMPGSR